MDKAQLAAMLDHSLLRPEMTATDVEEGCLDVIGLGLASVCVRPCDIVLATSVLAGSGIAVGTVIGFPHGTANTSVKGFEAVSAIRRGAQELDMVINIGALRDGDHARVEDDILEVVEAAEGRIVKVILETAYLTDDEKAIGCQIAEAARASFVKSSTGFAPSGATVADIRLMRATVGDRLGVKASGGIRTAESALAMIQAGASRIGTSASRGILEEIEA